LLSSYTKAINKAYKRTGSLFQQHTKTKLLLNEKQILTVLAYIHQNPLRRGLVKSIEEWEFSSYPAYTGMINDTLVEKSFALSKFNSIEEFKLFSKTKIEKIDFLFS
jgi:putative transposase